MITTNINQSKWVLLALILCSLAISTIEGQDIPSCASNLVPCSAFMNVTNPPKSCCDPLQKTISTQLECLCNLYSVPGLLPSFGINVTEALTLPARCGLSGDLSACGKAQSPGSSTTPTPPAGTDKDDAERIIVTSAKVLGPVLFLIAVTCFGF